MNLTEGKKLVIYQKPVEFIKKIIIEESKIAMKKAKKICLT